MKLSCHAHKILIDSGGGDDNGDAAAAVDVFCYAAAPAHQRDLFCFLCTYLTIKLIEANEKVLQSMRA